ncbi:YbaB/EbfC family nucleoid-associated protein [Actinopolymorpha pittospori]|uniref:DNA-binding protein YbaB n=1 Tax=Actinopolymorpha pittospori TaxID=648752 RepID=A0A927N2N5_9ACTN|nr:YbaB/EbfC family nucleoid-associated protein [Actinopolymorpha pittospori]MBE1611216.1 DNA-binding protein YbaB [Actinopolymorpha pittospori]
MSTDEYEKLLKAASSQLEAVQAATAKLGSIEGAGETADGRVRVRVISGAVRALEIDPRAMRMASEDLAAAVLEAIQLATDDANRKMAEIFEMVAPGAGASITGLGDPTKASESPDSIQASIDGIIESLQRGFREGL